MEGIGIYATSQDFAGCGYNGIVGAGETGNRVKQDDHVFFVFDHALGFFNHHFRHLDMALRRFVEGGGNHFAAHGTAHFGNLFRTFVNQQDNEFDIGIVGGNRVGDVLQHHGLTGFRRCNQQGALSAADGGH